jgi:AraC family transcriptional activator of pobA
MKQYQNFPSLQSDNLNESFPFQLRTIEWTLEQEEYTCTESHLHNHYEMIWILNGSGILRLDLQKIGIRNNHVFCIKPGQVHQFIPDPNTEGFIISFSESFLNTGEYEFDLTCEASFFELFTKPEGIFIQNEMEEDLKELIVKMGKEFNNLYPFRTQLIRRYLKILLIYLTRQFEEGMQVSQQTRNNELVKRFISLLDKNFKEMKMVADYANQLFITPNYLNEIVKKHTGSPAGHHIRHRVVLEAKRLARYSDICMKEIAYNLGFSDSAHFSKFFKTVTGSNFSDFKKGKITVALSA